MDNVWEYEDASHLLFDRICQKTNYLSDISFNITDDVFFVETHYRTKPKRILIISIFAIDHVFVMADIDNHTVQVLYPEEVLAHYDVVLEIIERHINEMLEEFEHEYIEHMLNIFDLFKKEKPPA